LCLHHSALLGVQECLLKSARGCPTSSHDNSDCSHAESRPWHEPGGFCRRPWLTRWGRCRPWLTRCAMCQHKESVERACSGCAKGVCCGCISQDNSGSSRTWPGSSRIRSGNYRTGSCWTLSGITRAGSASSEPSGVSMKSPTPTIIIGNLLIEVPPAALTTTRNIFRFKARSGLAPSILHRQSATGGRPDPHVPCCHRS
jgi:hypothetical protein